MIWKPLKLTREQMEERRLAGGRLLRVGRLTQAEIARRLGVSRATVSAWAQALKAGGLWHLHRRTSHGRPSKLTVQQQRALKRRLKRGARAAGFATERWTLRRVQLLIKRVFGVKYHPNYLNRLLRRLGLSPQKPVPRAAERDEALIKAWLEHNWPRIKKRRVGTAPPLCFSMKWVSRFWRSWAARGPRAVARRCCVV
jgi:putative transposase